MNKLKPYVYLLLLATLVGCGVALAQTFVQAVQLADVKSNGTKVGLFTTYGQPYYWDFRGPYAALKSGNTLTIGTAYAIQDPDMGTVESPNGVQMGTLTARPTCTAALRGLHWTVWTTTNGTTDAAPNGNTDGGVKDATYQCCKSAAVPPAYAWVAGYCN